MDPLTILGLIIGTLIIGAICAYIFKKFTQETTFEEAYGKNALKLLTEEKIQKAKAKVTKAKKSIGKAVIGKERQGSIGKQEEEETAPTVEAEEKKKAPKVQTEEKKKAPTEEAEEKKKPATPKANLSEKKEDTIRQESTSAEKKETATRYENSSSDKKESVHRAEANNTSRPETSKGSRPVETAEVSKDAQEGGAKKNKKKNRPKKADSEFDSFQGEDEPVSAPANQKEKKIERVEAAKTTVENVKKVANDVVDSAKQTINQVASSVKQSVPESISFNDVVERLKSLTDFEPKYISYLVNQDGAQHSKEAELQAQINALKKENNEKDKSVKQTSADLNNIRLENRKLKEDLKDQSDKYETFEQTVRTKLTEIIQLKEDNKRLSSSLSQAQQKSNQNQQLIREAEVLRAELNKKSNISNEEHSTMKNQIEKLHAENAELSKLCMSSKGNYENELANTKSELQRVREQHTKEHQAAQSQIHELSSELDRVITAYNDANKGQAFQYDQVQRLQSDNEKLSSEMNSLKTKLKDLEREVEQANTSVGQYKNHINQLSVEVQEAHNFKVKYNEDEKVISELEEQNTKLTKQLDIAHKKLHDFERLYKDSAAEKGKTQALEKKNQELEAEIQALNGKLASVANKANENETAEIKQLAEQLEQQKRKNQELRDTNYKLLESIQSQEAATKKLLSGAESKPTADSGLKDAVSAVTRNFQRLLPKNAVVPSLNGSCTPETFDAWTQKLVETCQKNISQSAPKSSNNNNTKEVEQLKDSVERYKSSLHQVRTQLAQVERVAEEQDREQRNRIAQLEKELKMT